MLCASTNRHITTCTERCKFAILGTIIARRIDSREQVYSLIVYPSNMKLLCITHLRYIGPIVINIGPEPSRASHADITNYRQISSAASVDHFESRRQTLT